MDQIEAAAGPETHTALPPSQSLRRAHGWAKAGYAIVPAVAGALVALPLAAISWTVLVRQQPMSAYHAWFLLCLIPAALLILASWVRFEKPGGLAVSAAEAPDLFALIEQVRAYLRAPAIDAVYLTEAFTARVVQRPSRGLFGGSRHEIVIGLPLLQSVSKAEAAVLIAHELGQLSGRQGNLAADVHRARAIWQRLLERLPQQPLYLALPFKLVTGAFARMFLELSASEERASIFAADRLAAEIAGLGTVGSALQRLKIAEEFLGEYWRRVAQEPVATPEPALNPHREMSSFLPRMTEWENASEVLEASLRQSGNRDPAHPTLAERLAALDLIAELPAPVTQSAAKLLGSALPKALDQFDAAWRARVGPAWRAAYDQLDPETKRLLDLDALADSQPLELGPAIERAKLAYFAGGLEHARSRYADLIEWHPEDGRAALAAGVALIDGGDEEGGECLRQALALAPRTDWTKPHAEDWYAVGEALLKTGADFGIDCLEQAIRIDPARADMAAFIVDRYLDHTASAINAA